MALISAKSGSCPVVAMLFTTSLARWRVNTLTLELEERGGGGGGGMRLIQFTSAPITPHWKVLHVWS